MMALLIAGAIFSVAGLVRIYLDRTSRSDTHHFGGTVELTHVWNTGAAFSLPIPKGTVGVLSALALLFAWGQRKERPLSAGLLLGGGLANAWERLRYRKVYDYVRFPKAPGKGKRFVWNLADFAILAGAIGLVISQKKR
ncbi:MAG: signal peptidase II [Oscillibacter sp.]|nr:signal peptidase II [Oscillibacter sp.]